MKYFTKKWYFLLELCSLINGVKIVEPEQLEGIPVEVLYEKKKDKFVEKTKSEAACSDISATLREIDKRLESESTPPKEKEELKRYREDYVHLSKITQKPREFDEETAKKVFEIEIDRKEQLCASLPRSIRKLFAGVKSFFLLCLDCMTEEVAKRMRVYLQKKANQVKKMADRGTLGKRKTLERFANYCDFRGCEDTILTDLKIEEDGISLDFDGYLVKFKNAKLIKCENEILDWNDDIYFSPMSYVVANEVYQVGKEKYKVHFLVKNIYQTAPFRLWYLTILFTDVAVEKQK